MTAPTGRVVQSRLDPETPDLLLRLRRATGLSDSELLRRGLRRLADLAPQGRRPRFEQAPPAGIRTVVKPVLLDTGCIVALVDRSERHHLDFADACLVHMADALDTGRVLTLDDDFAIYRWRRSRVFDRLLASRG